MEERNWQLDVNDVEKMCLNEFDRGRLQENAVERSRKLETAEECGKSTIPLEPAHVASKQLLVTQLVQHQSVPNDVVLRLGTQERRRAQTRRKLPGHQTSQPPSAIVWKSSWDRLDEADTANARLARDNYRL